MDPIDMEQAMKDAWDIFEKRVMSLEFPNLRAIAWGAWFGRAPEEKVING